METVSEPINDSPQTTEKKKTTVRILLADDHPIVRDGLKKLLQLEDDFEVVGEAGDGREVLEKVHELDPSGGERLHDLFHGATESAGVRTSGLADTRAGASAKRRSHISIAMRPHRT